MIVIFQGAESAAHRSTLDSVRELFDGPVPLVAGISYKSLRSRRLGPAYVKETAKLFPVVLEAGVSGAQMTAEEAAAYRDDYYRFLAECEDVTTAIQFDHPALVGGGYQMPDDSRLLPVLFDGADPSGLSDLLDAHGQVAMVYEGDKRMPPILRRHREGLLVALAQPDLLEAKRAGFNAVMTQAWLGPAKFGEIAVWDGTKFHRSGSNDKQKILRRYSQAITGAGLDMDLLVGGDARELCRLSAYSFLSWAVSLAEVSDTKEPTVVPEPETQESESAVEILHGVKPSRAQVPLPVFDRDEMTGLEEHADGTSSIRSRQILKASSSTIRVCDSCFLASTCPAFERASSCAFNFPIEVRTPSQVKELLHGMLELQASRVAFARFAEEVNGGYPDPAVGQEIDRLFRMSDRIRKFDERKERLTVSVETQSSGGGAGVLSRIFGERAALPATDPEVVVEEIIDAEVSDD